MLEELIRFDRMVFHFINDGLSNPVFDLIMPYLRNRYFWVPVYVFLAVFFIRNYRKYGWYMLLFFGITFGISDYFSASVVKPLVERLRPCNDPVMKATIHNIVPCGSGFSFPSTHATNHFALAFFLIVLFYTRWKPVLPLCLAWAGSICLAQVYVGVHYPVDVLSGAILGSMIGYVVGTLYLTIFPQEKWKAGNS